MNNITSFRSINTIEFDDLDDIIDDNINDNIIEKPCNCNSCYSFMFLISFVTRNFKFPSIKKN